MPQLGLGLAQGRLTFRAPFNEFDPTLALAMRYFDIFLLSFRRHLLSFSSLLSLHAGNFVDPFFLVLPKAVSSGS